MTQTESFLRGKIADTITSTATVPFDKKVSKVPVLTTGFITISPDTDNEEIFLYDGVTGTIGEAGTITITARGYDKETNTTDTGNQKSHLINSIFKGALNHVIINNKADLDDARFEGYLRVPVFADAAARDLVITAPVDGLIAYLLDVNDFTSRKNSLWINGLGGGGSATFYSESTDTTLTGVVDGVNDTFILSNSPASPSAITVVYNGITQELDADYTAVGTTITFTTAPVAGKVLALYPDSPVGSGNAKTRVTTDADASNGELYRSSDDLDNLYYQDSDGNTIKIYDNATDSLNILSNKASDAEVEAGVEDTKYVTSKAVKDNYTFVQNGTMGTLTASRSVQSGSDTSGSVLINELTVGLFTYYAGGSGTYTARVEVSDDDAIWSTLYQNSNTASTLQFPLTQTFVMQPGKYYRAYANSSVAQGSIDTTLQYTT